MSKENTDPIEDGELDESDVNSVLLDDGDEDDEDDDEEEGELE